MYTSGSLYSTVYTSDGIIILDRESIRIAYLCTVFSTRTVSLELEVWTAFDVDSYIFIEENIIK